MTIPSNPLYREIPLTQGQVAIVDADLFDYLNQWKWFAEWCEDTKSFYAMRSGKRANGKASPKIRMHRVVLGLSVGDPLRGDHVRTHLTLVNTRENLRVATALQNHQNRRRPIDNTSGYKGVSLCRRCGRWKACIRNNGKWVWLGYHSTPELAHAAYVKAAKVFHGAFANPG